MASDHDPSIEHEPHLRADRCKPDASEDRAEKTLAFSRNQSGQHLHSVHDEPAVFPEKQAPVIEQDWLCSECGYNLRGLTAGRRCPECGHVERYRPAPPGAGSYRSWLQERRAQVSASASWLVVILGTLAVAPVGAFAIVLGTSGARLFGVAIYGPIIGETAKVAAALLLIEIKPYLIRNREQIILMTLGSALVLAAIQNAGIIQLFTGGPAAGAVEWRWLACTAGHLACTALVLPGLIAAWEQCMTQGRRPRLSPALSRLVPAMILHGAYNAVAYAMQWSGFLF